ncbi:MAG: Dam family site-specific DNA-(adenine-N6)-methyltransferase [Planctomycetota bacterium]|nr:Dam family site-specific DNA-(adenine-N6)-methyltransferase [Planctomycetota bacterium]
MQLLLFEKAAERQVVPFRGQLLKWVGNKQRLAHQIVSFFPANVGRYYEPFLGSGAVLATLKPEGALGSDTFRPLMEIWQALKDKPQTLVEWYTARWRQMQSGDKVAEYERVKASYNAHPNGADLLFLCRACYGGVVRFRQNDGYMSTPCGVHSPIAPDVFAARVAEWHRRTAGAQFQVMSYDEAMSRAESGDLVYCDPPYAHSQSILYGAQAFDFAHLLDVIAACKQRGVRVALSMDGSKRSGALLCDLPIPTGLFEREVFLNCGRSMLKRFQMQGRTLEEEVVSDRLLLTY